MTKSVLPASLGYAPLSMRNFEDEGENEMKAQFVEAIAPATSANLGAGFDVFSVALDALFDSVSVEVVKRSGIEIAVEGTEAHLVPVEPDKNTAGVVAKALLDLSNKKCGLVIRIRKGVRLGRGLGSSAASAAAAALAVNEALGLCLSKRELIPFAAQGEVASAGFPHADNVSASVLGFLTIVKSYRPLEVIQLPLPKNIEFVVAIPEIMKSTASMRSVLPKHIKLSDVVHNVGHATTFIAGIALNDVNLMGRGMVDSIVEPARVRMFPEIIDVKLSALKAGAAGVAISGAGPSVLALVKAEKETIESVAKAMKNAFEGKGMKAQVICAKPGPGAKVVRREQL
ncbi:MAG: homoserine kinase [Candidatus Bathycorpusculaceae bacterium]